MPEALCPICRNSNRVEVLRLTSKRGIDFGVWRCGCCRHIWRTEPWKTSDQITFYEEASPTAELMETISSKNVKIFEKFLQLADELNPHSPRRMVDFGCSCGTAMQMFKKHNWDVLGIEILPTAQKVLDERNLPWAPSMKGSGLAPQSVDIVVMSDCIYYIADPVEILSEIRSYLKPQGRLFLRHPTRAGALGILLKVSKEKALSDKIWGSYIHMFSRKSTELSFKKAGFTTVKFLKEKGYDRPLKTEIVHRAIRAADFITLGLLDLTLSWIVIAERGQC